MMPSAPRLQQMAYIARRSCGPPAVCRKRRPAAAGVMGEPAEAGTGVITGNGCQRHARCGRSTSIQDVVSVARQFLLGRAPGAPRNFHSRPNGGTRSSGATRGRASAPSTGTRGDGVMRAVRGATRVTVPARRGSVVANRDIVVSRRRPVDLINLILVPVSGRLVRGGYRDGNDRAGTRQMSASRGIIRESCRCTRRCAMRRRRAAMPVRAGPVRRASPGPCGADSRHPS
ncbi:hypothetical protein BAR24066_04587 [Burkholderia arboris]|uniref:Uncharacterized protein n=1 Tax=Burkholderia arboris TaxID=488730 RepID=A0A9Q9SLE9_9BURK|nr:hypothetical protein BAR24066_04587 [Burkholderia arboris]